MAQGDRSPNRADSPAESSSSSSGTHRYATRARRLFEEPEYDDTCPPAYRSVQPTDDEVEQWADEERRRRKEILEGPTEEEKIRWAYDEYRRRLRHPRRSRADSAPGEGPIWDARDWERCEDRSIRYRNDAEFAMLGLVRQLMEFPFNVMAGFVESGRRWDRTLPRRRRRVRMDDDDPYCD